VPPFADRPAPGARLTRLLKTSGVCGRWKASRPAFTNIEITTEAVQSEPIAKDMREALLAAPQDFDADLRGMGACHHSR